MQENWNGLPYHPISSHYNKLFHEKVYKISVAVVDDCPNRRGLKGMETCVFCDVWGSAANADSLLMPLKKQIEEYKVLQIKKFKAKKFLVYFQAYTNTFSKIDILRANFDVALSYPDICGIVVGTRPDCLSASVLNLWQEVHERSFVSVELGVQSFSNRDLSFYRRGHTAEQSIKAIQKISKETSVDLGIHLMFGAPEETDSEVITAAQICNDLPITNVKLHNLHVLKNTELEKFYAAGNFAPLDFDTYAHRVGLFIEHLRPEIAIHRLAAYSPRWDELIAPEWTANRMRTHQGIIDYLNKNQSFQAKKFNHNRL